MKLVMFGERYQERPGVIIDDRLILDLEIPELESPHSLEELLEFNLLPELDELIAHRGKLPLIPLESVRLGPPLAGLGKIIAVGLNYREHIREMSDATPPNPLLFAKAATSLAGPYDALMLPPAEWAREIDYEVELGVVIGHLCHRVAVADALAYVAGYTIVNDITARDVQRAESQWFRAKSYDGFCPIGPFLVTADEVIDAHGLSLSTRVNGEIRQQSNTDQMLYSVPELVSFISQSMTLLPGDIIATGTPSGIGAGMTPPTYLQPGDLLELSIDGLGQQRYTVVSFHDDEMP